jgi:CheY-like chemotaxis protein
LNQKEKSDPMRENLTGRKILIVDDERPFCNATAEILNFHGYQTFAAYNADDAISILKDVTPDLIIVDFRMPQIDGIDLLRSLSPKPSLLHTPFIMISGNAMDADWGQAWQAGADAFLAKPFKVEELLNMIDHILSPEPEN